MLSEDQLPSVGEIRFYLMQAGWVEHPPGPAGALWTKDAITLAVPAGDDPAVKASLVSRLAAVMQRSDLEVCDDVRYFATDVVNFRIANARSVSSTSIPLGSAEYIIQNIRRLLRSCGTTAFRAQGDLKGHYSRIGDIITQSARMAHTRQGSFIFPVMFGLHLGDVTQNQHDELVTVSSPEPPERRVLRTVAQSLNAVDEAVIQPSREPTLDRLHAAVEMGVSRELCIAISNVLGELWGGELDTSFRWAPAVEGSRMIPTHVTIPQAARELLDQAALKLKIHQIEPARTMTGAIIALRHEPETDYGDITISTARNGRPAEVRIRLPYSQYREDRRVLIVEGEVHGGRGKRLHIEEPARCEPIEDIFSTFVE